MLKMSKIAMEWRIHKLDGQKYKKNTENISVKLKFNFQLKSGY